MKTFETEITPCQAVPVELAISANRYMAADRMGNYARAETKKLFGIVTMGQAMDIASASLIKRSEKSICEEELKAELQTMKARTNFNDQSILDAKMLYVIASKVELNEVAEEYRTVILDALKHMQRHAITQMTYQDIILNNPAQGMRTFTTGKAAISEGCFYRGHQIIEDHVSDLIDALRTAHETGDVSYLDVAKSSATQAGAIMMKFRSELNKSHFNAFKGYFDTNPMTGEKGPSGVFSATIPHVDVLLAGAENYEGQDYLRDNESYFPQRDLAYLRQSIAENVNLSERFNGNAGALDKLEAVSKRMVSFRNMHKGAVIKHIGKDVVGSAEGGSALQFLHDRIESSMRKVKLIRSRKDKNDNGSNIPTV
jgi:hypothetical protein